MLGLLRNLGDRALYGLQHLGQMGLFLLHCLRRLPIPPYRPQAVVHQLHFIAVRSTPVILVAGLFSGMVLALQGHHSLEKFGSVDLLGSVVALGLVRELGPVLTALLVMGRAGSAMCAEIGIMRIGEQLDALECMAIDPYRYVMAPKIIATVIGVPALTSMFDVAGILGGYLTGVVLFGVNEAAFFQGMYDSTEWADVRMGLFKSLIFGFIVVWVATAKGFLVHRMRGGALGAESVSRATTDAVVMASLAVLVANYLVASLLLL
jgi:phospholipid/cholesterol/gamma-HCH transport system permease protein